MEPSQPFAVPDSFRHVCKIPGRTVGFWWALRGRSGVIFPILPCVTVPTRSRGSCERLLDRSIAGARARLQGTRVRGHMSFRPCWKLQEGTGFCAHAGRGSLAWLALGPRNVPSGLWTSSEHTGVPCKSPDRLISASAALTPLERSAVPGASSTAPSRRRALRSRRRCFPLSQTHLSDQSVPFCPSSFYYITNRD